MHTDATFLWKRSAPKSGLLCVQSYTSCSLLICFHVQYTCMIYLDIQLTLVSVKQLSFILIFKLRTVLWKLNCTCICFLTTPTCRTKMAPLDPDSLIMRGRGFLESGMTLMSNILLKLMWLDQCSKLTVLFFFLCLRLCLIHQWYASVNQPLAKCCESWGNVLTLKCEWNKFTCALETVIQMGATPVSVC